MRNLFTKTSLFLFTFICFGLCLQAQKLEASSVKITINGTSTIHEWDMMSTEGKFSGFINGNKVENIAFIIPVKSLVSGKSAMDRNTYNALKAEKYPNFVFTADEINVLRGNAEVKGKLTITNVSKEITLPMNVSQEDGAIILQGFMQLDMKDYNIEPPKFMMGSVKTGDVISIKFIVSLKKESEE